MNGWEWELVVIVVHYFELLEHIMNSLCNRNMRVSLKMVNDVLSRHVFMSYLQRNHHQGNISLQTKHLVKSSWIKKDVEFCSRSDVSFSDSSTHHHNFGNFLFYVRVCKQDNTQVCQGTCISPNKASLMSHNSFVYFLETIFSICFFR